MWEGVGLLLWSAALVAPEQPPADEAAAKDLFCQVSRPTTVPPSPPPCEPAPHSPGPFPFLETPRSFPGHHLPTWTAAAYKRMLTRTGPRRERTAMEREVWELLSVGGAGAEGLRRALGDAAGRLALQDAVRDKLAALSSTPSDPGLSRQRKRLLLRGLAELAAAEGRGWGAQGLFRPLLPLLPALLDAVAPADEGGRAEVFRLASREASWLWRSEALVGRLVGELSGSPAEGTLGAAERAAVELLAAGLRAAPSQSAVTRLLEAGGARALVAGVAGPSPPVPLALLGGCLGLTSALRLRSADEAQLGLRRRLFRDVGVLPVLRLRLRLEPRDPLARLLRRHLLSPAPLDLPDTINSFEPPNDHLKAGVSIGRYKRTEIFVRCPASERFCVKIRFEDGGTARPFVKYVTGCAHRQTCARQGCALSQSPRINDVRIATCCCNSSRCNQALDVDSVLRRSLPPLLSWPASKASALEPLPDPPPASPAPQGLKAAQGGRGGTGPRGPVAPPGPNRTPKERPEETTDDDRHPRFIHTPVQEVVHVSPHGPLASSSNFLYCNTSPLVIVAAMLFCKGFVL